MGTSQIWVIDASVWIDLAEGSLLKKLGCLGHRLLISDVVVAELISPITFAEANCEIEVAGLPGQGVRLVLEYSQRYRRLSAPDMFTLALAKLEGAVILTGDRQLRFAALAEGVPLKGTLGVIDEMVAGCCISPLLAGTSLETIMLKNKRLPGDECALRLEKWR